MRGWLLDTNVTAELSRPGSDPKIAAWADRQDEEDLYLSILTIGEYRKGVANLPPVIDTLLAATAIERRLWLATRNLRDIRDTGAALFDPWNDDPAGFAVAR